MVTRCGLTERDFYQEFDGSEECLLVTIQHGIALLESSIRDAVAHEQSWLARVRAGLLGVLGFLDSEPAWAQVLVVRTTTIGSPILELRERAFASLARALDAEAPVGDSAGAALPRELLAELVVGGAFSVIHTRLLAEEADTLTELAPSLMSMVVLPYLGADAGRTELTRNAAPVGRRRRTVDAEGLPARATYRTVLVLEAIGTSPHSSNRDIAAAAGLSDEGQTSRLLSRLRRQGLVENVGLGAARGEPNAWLLTADGKRMAELIGNQFASQKTHPQPTAHRSGRVACQS